MADANMYVLNPFFQTRSFDDMVKPLAMYAAAYKEQEAKVEDMTDKASALEWIANQDPNSQTAALYRDMSDKIKGIRDDMMMNGLTGGLRSRILGTRRIYSANSSEITRRYEDMVKYKDRMAALQDKDPSMVFSADSQNIGIDDFAGGKRPKIKAISGNEIMARGAAVGKRLTSQIFGDGVLGQEMGGQFWKVYQSQGMDDNALWNALQAVGQASESKFNMVKQVIDGVYNSFKDFTPGDQQRLKDRFIEGVYAGSVYDKKVSYQNNGEYINAAQRQSLALQEAESKRSDLSLRLSGLQAGWIVDPKTGTIKKDTSQPKETVIKDKDGGFTVIQTPYTPDGVLDPSRQVTIKVDENGNTVSVTGVPANPSNGPGASNGASGAEVADQGESSVTDKQLQEIKDNGDTGSYVTWTYKGRTPTLIPMTSGSGKTTDGSGLIPWYNFGRRLYVQSHTNEQSPLMDWAMDLDYKLDNRPEQFFYRNKSNPIYRTWIKTDEAHMPSDIRAAYDNAKHEFINTKLPKDGKMSHYDIYYVQDLSRPDAPPEFMFHSKADNKLDFKYATQEEANAIAEVKRIMNEAKTAGYKMTRHSQNKVYEAAKSGKYIYFDPSTGTIKTTVGTVATAKPAGNTTGTTQKQTKQQNDSSSIASISAAARGEFD